MRVLLLNEFFHPDNQGGTATATTNIATRLIRNHGAEVDVLTSRHAYRDERIAYSPEETYKGIRIFRVESPNHLRRSTGKRFIGNLILANKMALKALSLPKPDVVLVTTAPLTLPLVARFLLRFRRVPYAYLIYDLDPDRTVALGLMEENSKLVRLLRSYQTKWLKNAERIVVIGRCMRDRVSKAYSLDPAKMVVAEVGADPDVVRPMPKQTEFRRKNGIDGFILLYSGNFGKYHDFDTVLGAAALLRDKRPDIHIVLVGGGNKRKEVVAKVEEGKLSNVHLFDFVPEEELADLLASADMHLVTLEPGMEGLCVPSKFYTCLASGRPVVALMKENTEVAMTVNEAACGVRIEIGDSNALASALEKAASDPEALQQEGERARAVFEKTYTIDHVVAKIYGALQECAGTGRSSQRVSQSDQKA